MPILHDKTPKKNYQAAHEKLYRSIINRQKLTRKKSGWYFLGGFGAVEAIKHYQGKDMKDWIAMHNLTPCVQRCLKTEIGIRWVFAWQLGSGQVNNQNNK
ncbi:hypothetical protein HpCOL199_04320 [Helicobacter pylori]